MCSKLFWGKISFWRNLGGFDKRGWCPLKWLLWPGSLIVGRTSSLRCLWTKVFVCVICSWMSNPALAGDDYVDGGAVDDVMLEDSECCWWWRWGPWLWWWCGSWCWCDGVDGDGDDEDGGGDVMLEDSECCWWWRTLLVQVTCWWSAPTTNYATFFEEHSVLKLEDAHVSEFFWTEIVIVFFFLQIAKQCKISLKILST